MPAKSPILLRILFVFLMLVLVFPAVQQHFKFITSGKLHGDIRNAEAIPLTDSSWFAGSYQEAMNAYLNDHIGCREDLVRLNNQLDFSLFGVLHAKDVVMGKNNYLYEQGYIHSYCGRNFEGEAPITERLRKLRRIQDTLESMGKTLVWVFASSKARVYPEFMPDNIRCEPTPLTNYEVIRRGTDSLGIHHIDLIAWFNQLKATSPYPLFSRQGTHWTQYGGLIAQDTLNKYLSRVRNINMPQIKFVGFKETKKPLDPVERDIALGLNLAVPVSDETFIEPDFMYEDIGRVKPSVIYLGDSYVWTFFARKMPQFTNSYFEFWYYFTEVWTMKTFNGEEPTKRLLDHKWWESIDKVDCMVMMFSEPSLNQFGSGFIEMMYEHYFGKDGVPVQGK